MRSRWSPDGIHFQGLINPEFCVRRAFISEQSEQAGLKDVMIMTGDAGDGSGR